jgi:KDO2-lipid IV(A) lauroyltransferase
VTDEPRPAPSAGSRAAYLAYRAGAAFANALPGPVAEPVAGAVGRTLALAMPARRRIVERNLHRAAGADLDGLDLQRSVSDVFASYARYWLELFRLPHEGAAAIDRKFHVDGYEHLEAALVAGRGAIMTLPHVGGFEYAAAWIANRGHPPTVVVEAVEPPELLEWFKRQRAALGMEVVPLGPHAAGRMLEALKANRVICLLADRDISGDGVEVEFFGERTTMPGGPAVLALRTGAPILPVAVYFEARGQHRAVIQPPVPAERLGRLREDVERVTQDIARRFEDLIRAHPEQWHVMQPNWPSDREGT